MNVTVKKSGWNYSLFILLALIWSASFLNIKIVVTTLPPIFGAMMRAAISMITLGIIFCAMRRKIFVYSSEIRNVWLAGLFTQAVPFALLFYGEKFIAPALASIINSTVSIWALLLGACLFHDTTQWTVAKIAGLMTGFAGIVIIFAPYINNTESSMIGIISILLMAVAYAIGGLINQHVIFAKKKISFETNLFQQHVASIVALCILSLSMETWPTWETLSRPDLLMALLYLGVMATAVAWVIYFYLIKEWNAVRSASVMYIVPALAILWDYLFLHLIPSTAELVGAAAILTGVVLIQWTRKPKPLLEPT